MGYGPWMGEVDNMASDQLFSLDVEQCKAKEASEDEMEITSMSKEPIHYGIEIFVIPPTARATMANDIIVKSGSETRVCC